MLSQKLIVDYVSIALAFIASSSGILSRSLVYAFIKFHGNLQSGLRHEVVKFIFLLVLAV